MKIEFIVLLSCFICLVLILVYCYQILKKQQEQELIQLVNDIFCEISKSNFQSMQIMYAKPFINNMFCINTQHLKNHNDSSFRYKDFEIEIYPRGNTIFIEVIGKRFYYKKSIEI